MREINSIKKNNIKSQSISNQLSKYILVFIITLSIVQVFPVIKDTYYNEIRVLLYTVFILLGSVKIVSNKYIYRNKFNVYFLMVLLYTFTLSSILLLVGESYKYFEMLVPFGIYISSYTTEFTEEEVKKILMWYIVLTLILGFSSIFYYGEGFNITQQYFLSSKNQIGPMIGYGGFISFYIGFYTKDKPMKISMFLSGLSSVILLSVIRNRTGLLMLLVLFLLLFYKNKKEEIGTKKYYVSILIFLVFLFILFLLDVHKLLYNWFEQAFFLNYTVGDLDSISAGRWDVYTQSLSFIGEYPWLGELSKNYFLSGTPHNYLLYNWVKYGLVFTIPMSVFYIYLWRYSLLGLFKENMGNFLSLANWLLLYSLLISLLEYTYPYTPGSAQLIVWFVLGQLVLNKNKKV